MLILGEGVKRPEAVDDDDPRFQLLQEAFDRGKHLSRAARCGVAKPVFGEQGTEVFVDDPTVADCSGIEELQGLSIADDLVQRLRHGGEVEGGVLQGRVVEGVLLAEDGLAAAR